MGNFKQISIDILNKSQRIVSVKINIVRENDIEIGIVDSNEVLITNVQSALDLMATVQYETGSNRIIMNKALIHEDFF